jgi:hypothetical protein
MPAMALTRLPLPNGIPDAKTERTTDQQADQNIRHPAYRLGRDTPVVK